MLFHVEWEFIDNTEAGQKLPSTSSRNGSLVPHSSRASISLLAGRRSRAHRGRQRGGPGEDHRALDAVLEIHDESSGADTRRTSLPAPSVSTDLARTSVPPV